MKSWAEIFVRTGFTLGDNHQYLILDIGCIEVTLSVEAGKRLLQRLQDKITWLETPIPDNDQWDD